MTEIGILIIVAMLSIGLSGSISERRRYNNGVCRKNGKKWIYFDTDSQGGRGYKAGNEVMWVSWPFIDNVKV